MWKIGCATRFERRKNMIHTTIANEQYISKIILITYYEYRINKHCRSSVIVYIRGHCPDAAYFTGYNTFPHETPMRYCIHNPHKHTFSYNFALLCHLVLSCLLRSAFSVAMPLQLKQLHISHALIIRAV